MRQILIAFALSSFAVSNSYADFIVSIQSRSIAPGSNASVDVYLEGAGDGLTSFSYQFEITSSFGSTGFVQFAETQSRSEQSAVAVANLHQGYALGTDVDESFFTTQRGAGNNPLALVGNDSTATGDPATLNGRYLFAQLELTTDVNTSGTYSISLNPNPSLTFFDPDLDPDNDNNIAFSFTPGTITVGSVTAVPEPSSLVFVALSGVAWTCRTLRRRKASIINPMLA